jgi:FixJ family two-component response regulator
MGVENGTILVVDDDEDVLLAAKFLLKRHFSKIVTVNSPETMDELLKQNSFDVALLDMNYTAGATTGQEGFDLLNYLVTHTPKTRVVMMTAYGDIDLAIKAIKEGAVDFIVKPWDNAKLVNTVISAFKKVPESTAGPKGKSPKIAKETEPVGMSEVERIFMFLDITSSTSIAEKLGHIKYFELLNDFFMDIAAPIEDHEGEIYQYIGDEVVVSWPLKKGIEDFNVLNCFFDIVDTMDGLSQNYLNRYNIVPTFKAGLHYGKVSTGTIGTLKKEIIYTGDVLNTTSRIEGQCNRYRVNNLLSKDLIEVLPDGDFFEFDRIGEISLRGKASFVTLYTSRRRKNDL